MTETSSATTSLFDVLAERLTRRRRGEDHRDDGRRVVLVIEGGGMRGTVSGGMAREIHELGLTPLFDAVYGASAGAINAAWLLSSRPEGIEGWRDPRFAQALIDPRNVLRRRPIIDVERLIEDVYVNDWVLPYESVLTGSVAIHPLATDVATGQSVDLAPMIDDAADLRLAIRASAALPLVAGPPIRIAGRRFYDAGLAESVPYRRALADGATHALVLRSRRSLDAADPSEPSRGNRLFAATALQFTSPALRAAYLERDRRLQEDDDTLAGYDAEPEATVVSIRPADNSPRVSRLESRGEVLEPAFEAGREAVRRRLAHIGSATGIR